MTHRTERKPYLSPAGQGIAWGLVPVFTRHSTSTQFISRCSSWGKTVALLASLSSPLHFQILRNVSCTKPLHYLHCLRDIRVTLLCCCSFTAGFHVRWKLRTARYWYSILSTCGRFGFCSRNFTHRSHSGIHFVQIFSHNIEELHCCCWYLFVKLQLPLLV